jgi:hypothetical protein
MLKNLTACMNYIQKLQRRSRHFAVKQEMSSEVSQLTGWRYDDSVVNRAAIMASEWPDPAEYLP